MINADTNMHGATCSSPACGGGVDPGFNPGETEGATSLHAHLGKKLDDATYLLGFAWSIIDGLNGGIPASDKTIAEFHREYNAHFDPKQNPFSPHRSGPSS